METYKYEKSRQWYERAIKVIPQGVPGHLGPGEGCFMPPEAYPFFGYSAKGSYFIDVDGNRFLDYMCAYGPNVLGYSDRDVDTAAVQQLKLANCTTSPSFKMVEFAELLTETTKKDWAFFCKNGGDVTSFAVLVARAYKSRKKMIFINGFYHGVAPWCSKADYPGVLVEDVCNNVYIDFNDIEQLKAVCAKYRGEIAGLIATPYMHGNFVDNILPAEGYWQEVRRICTEEDIVLIIDDVRCGFRLNTSGSDHHYGFEADLICFCKALANGYNVSALCGKKFLQTPAGNVTYTGSYWCSAVPFAAGIACITKMKATNCTEYFRYIGTKIGNGLREVADANGFDLRVSGEPALFYLRIANDPDLYIHQEWNSELMRRGVFITNHHNHFVNLSLTEADVDLTMRVADEAFKAVRKNHPELFEGGNRIPERDEIITSANEIAPESIILG